MFSKINLFVTCLYTLLDKPSQRCEGRLLTAHGIDRFNRAEVSLPKEWKMQLCSLTTLLSLFTFLDFYERFGRLRQKHRLYKPWIERREDYRLFFRRVKRSRLVPIPTSRLHTVIWIRLISDNATWEFSSNHFFHLSFNDLNFFLIHL